MLPLKLLLYFSPPMKHYILLFLLSFFISSTYGQSPQKIELVNADVSEFDQTINAKATRLIGNVVFSHQQAFMYCDSAWLYRDENKLEAFGSVRIKKGDTLNLTGKRLLYDGNTKFAQLFEDVVMTDRKTILRTSRLDYDLSKEIAYYTDSANIVDGENTLTSKTGSYYSSSHEMFFRRNVLLVNPKFTMESDTLRYNTTTKTAFFLGPTYIRSKENLIYCESGWYQTESQQSNFRKNAYLKSKEQRLGGDSIIYERTKGIGKVFGSVSVLDTVNNIIISGDYGEYHENTDSSWVVGHALMTQIMNGDSLFMHADTLMAIGRDTTAEGRNKKNLYAFHKVKLFSADMQGKCDSLVYNQSDSTIRLFYDPILWSGMNQLTGDSIYMQTANSEITFIYLNNNSFIASIADSNSTSIPDSVRYNQIKGKNMTGFLADNKIYKIDVMGNGQTIYYAKNKKEKNFAVNRADCSDLTIYVNENKVKSITLLNDPDGTLYPIKELSINELKLKGFQWQGKFRPQSKESLFEE